MESINKSGLIEIIANKGNCSKKDAESTIDMFIEGIKEGLAKSEKLTLVGFGTFYKQHREAGKGRNPKTGEEINVSASVLPKFKAGQGLKDAVN